jgi:hypothetical protein
MERFLFSTLLRKEQGCGVLSEYGIASNQAFSPGGDHAETREA